MRIRTYQRLTLAVVLPIMTMTLFACGAPAPNASVVQVSKAQHFSDSKSGGTSAPCANDEPLINGDCGETVTASCPSGDKVLGGGYSVDDPLAFVTSSYTVTDSAWTVTAHDEGQDGGSHAFTVTAYAECLHGNVVVSYSSADLEFPLPHDGSNHVEHLDCDPGFVVTGGGFRYSNGTDENIPTASGWTVDLFTLMDVTTNPWVFVVCIQGHVRAAGQPVAIDHPNVGKGDDLSVNCPAGTLLAGGGAQTMGFGNITGIAANSAGTLWQAHARANGVVGGPVTTYRFTANAICLEVI